MIAARCRHSWAHWWACIWARRAVAQYEHFVLDGPAWNIRQLRADNNLTHNIIRSGNTKPWKSSVEKRFTSCPFSFTFWNVGVWSMTQKFCKRMLREGLFWSGKGWHWWWRLKYVYGFIWGEIYISALCSFCRYMQPLACIRHSAFIERCKRGHTFLVLSFDSKSKSRSTYLSRWWRGTQHVSAGGQQFDSHHQKSCRGEGEDDNAVGSERRWQYVQNKNVWSGLRTCIKI